MFLTAIYANFGVELLHIAVCTFNDVKVAPWLLSPPAQYSLSTPVLVVHCLNILLLRFHSGRSAESLAGRRGGPVPPCFALVDFSMRARLSASS